MVPVVPVVPVPIVDPVPVVPDVPVPVVEPVPIVDPEVLPVPELPLKVSTLPLPVDPEPVVDDPCVLLPLPVVDEPCVLLPDDDRWVFPLFVVVDVPCVFLLPVDPVAVVVLGVVVLGLPPEFVVCACALKAAITMTIAPTNTCFFITGIRLK